MRFQKEHRIELPMARFLELTFNPEFLRRMNIEGMKIQAYESLERSVDGSVWTMKNRITPQDNMPGFLKKLIGGGFYYEESISHQKGSDTVTSNMVPSVMRDKLRMGYTMRVRADGESACRRSMEWEVEVKIFGVGGQIEKFAAGEIERGMEASAQYLNQHGKTAA